MVVIFKFRTPVVLKGGSTLAFRFVCKFYCQNGMVKDLFALLPFNLILGINETRDPFLLIIILRLSRMVAVYQAMGIFSLFELTFKKQLLMMHIIRAGLLLFILSHWTACFWYILDNNFGKESNKNWIVYNGLENEYLSIRYLRTFYMVINIVTSVGYGDMFALNDLERMLIVFIICLGDCLFAVAFGLIAGISMNIT